MEDAVQIIIFILFFIFSILSSNKKKKKNKKPKVPVNVKPKPDVTKTRQEKTPQEIFEELFGIKTHEPVTTKKEEHVKETKYKTWYADDEFTQRKHNDDYSYKEEELAEKRKLEEEKLKHDDINLNYTSFKHKSLNKYSRLLQNPSTLRDYIVVAEILNKPKALRRR